jgi:hypothetical protein
MKKNIAKACLFLAMLSSSSAFSWSHSIDLGYGFSHDPNNTHYNNSGFLLSSDLVYLNNTAHSFWTINGSLGQWHSSAPEHQNLTTAAIALAMRYYVFSVSDKYPAYLMASGGPAYLSTKHFGTNVQGSNLAFQLFGGLGVELDKVDLNLRMVHYSNAKLANPNEGYNILYLLSVGYLF